MTSSHSQNSFLRSSPTLSKSWLNPRVALHLAVLGALAGALSPASAGGLLGGVGSVAAGATSSVGGAVGLGGGSGLGGLGGGLSGSGGGMLGATLTGNGLQSGVGSAVSRPLTSATGSVGGVGTGRAWGTFEDAKGAVKEKATFVKDRAKAATSQGGESTKGLVGGGVGKARSVTEGAKGNAMSSLADGVVLSRSFQLPAIPQAAGQAQAQGQASVGGSASPGRAKVAGNASARSEAKAGR